MTIDKIDTSVFMLASNRSSQSGNGVSRQMIFANKINEIVDTLGSMATTSTIAAINTQVGLIAQGLDATNQALTNYNSAISQSLTALAQRVTALEFQPATAIANLSESAVNISVLNLAALQALGLQQNNQAQTINKILAVMRTRKEINT